MLIALAVLGSARDETGCDIDAAQNACGDWLQETCDWIESDDDAAYCWIDNRSMASVECDSVAVDAWMCEAENDAREICFDEFAGQDWEFCMMDAEQFCMEHLQQEMFDFGAIFDCMMNHEEDLSQMCRDESMHLRQCMECMQTYDVVEMECAEEYHNVCGDHEDREECYMTNHSEFSDNCHEAVDHMWNACEMEADMNEEMTLEEEEYMHHEMFEMDQLDAEFEEHNEEVLMEEEQREMESLHHMEEQDYEMEAAVINDTEAWEQLSEQHREAEDELEQEYEQDMTNLRNMVDHLKQMMEEGHMDREEAMTQFEMMAGMQRESEEFMKEDMHSQGAGFVVEMFDEMTGDCVPVNHVFDNPGEVTCDCVDPNDPCLSEGQCVEEPACGNVPDEHDGEHSMPPQFPPNLQKAMDAERERRAGSMWSDDDSIRGVDPMTAECPHMHEHVEEHVEEEHEHVEEEHHDHEEDANSPILNLRELVASLASMHDSIRGVDPMTAF